jgi:hypothetical protein
MVQRSKNGQMLIVVILVMIVALTVGLSLASRTILNLRISRQNDQSQRAFQAAEAGVEQIIQSGNQFSSDFLANRAQYSTSVIYPQGQGFMLNGGELVDQDTGMDVWLSNYPDFTNPQNTTLTIYWGTDNQTICNAPGSGQNSSQVKSALEVIILSGLKATPTASKYFYEANGCTGGSARFSNATSPSPGALKSTINFSNSASIPVTTGLLMRVIPVFNSSKIYIESTAALPTQGQIIQSTGKAGETSRKVSYFSSYPQVPVEIFPYTLVAPLTQ